MLRELRIKNFAVIDEVALELEGGLNVITGETGAGKSIILNALGLICGDRVSSDVIRHGEEDASVEALFEDLPDGVRERIRAASFEADDDLVVKRVLSRSGKNRVYLAGALSQLNFLGDIGRSLVHIYGQHEHHTLLQPDTHIALLDAFGGLAESVADMGARFHALESVWQSLRKTREVVEQRKKERALLQSQAEEIANARLNPDEEEELQARKNVLLHSEKLYQGCLEGEELLYEGENALLGRLSRYANRLRDLSVIDARLQNSVDLLSSAVAQLEEVNRDLRRYAEQTHFEPRALEQLEDRLAEIHRLKRKYNGSVEDILRIQSEVESELKSLERDEEEIPGLERAFESARKAAWDAAARLSLERQKTAKKLKREMEKELRSLGMRETAFDVRFHDLSEKDDEPPYLIAGKRLTALGSDQVEFYFSPNPGEPPKALARIASGGELSRIMLAIKSLVLKPGDIPTLLFDEVDAGIGGAIAEVVGQKLKQVAASHQILCVTHLPQIAALADVHYAVRKEVIRNRTVTQVRKLTDRERVQEIARMLGGVRITDKTLRHAEEMVRASEKAPA
jgi:DNA repair protein RecN (Recombination protein N)